MNNVGYYHCYLTDNPSVWSSIFMEQMKYADDSGLLDNLKVLRVTAITQNDGRVQNFLNLCNSYRVRMDINLVINTVDNDKQMVSGLDSGNVITEATTFSRIYEDAQNEDCNVLYFHSKGVTSFDRHFANDTFLKFYYWRHYLNWGVLERWKDCIIALANHDVSGVNYQTVPEPHYSGGFWWTTSSHIRNLPDPKSTDWWYDLKARTKDDWLRTAPDRYKDEYWIAYKDGLNPYNIEGVGENPAFTLTPRKLYT